MNHVYRSTWNDALQQYVPAVEAARGRHKGGKARRTVIAAAAALALTTGVATAGPAGGQVTAGTGSVSQSGSTTTITQSSQNLSLSWQNFNIGAQETVDFIQPSASAIAVNRILGSSGSVILGHLDANGQVYLINPNGILFGQGAQVNVSGLVASTLDFSDTGLAGITRTFAGAGDGSVINQGSINAGNYVALMGNYVGNQGTINAQLGTVALAAGSAVTLTFGGNSLVHMVVDRSVLNSLAENGGLIQANGGQVTMTAGARNSLLASVVNNTGVIEAQTVENRNGTITLLGGMAAGTVHVGGTLDASAPHGGNGGQIDTSAANVKIDSGAAVTTLAANGKAGAWTIDPQDFTIAASGGDITGATLSTELGGGNVTIQSNGGATAGAGNVNVNDAVSWSANQLTLSAQNNVNINTAMSGSGTASLALQYGQGAVKAGSTSNYFLNNGAQVNLPAGQNFSTKLGSDGATVTYTVITSLGAAGSTTGLDLQGMNGNLAGNYVLGANIDATASSSWNAGAGFAPVGNNSTNSAASQFTGTFDGLGNTISNLAINLPSTSFVGLFGSAGKGSAIRNVGLLRGNVSGAADVGALAGSNLGTISNSYATGSVSGLNTTSATDNTTGYCIGGLVGQNGGTIRSSYATGNVSTALGLSVGGLAGQNSGLIVNSYATGTVSAGTGTAAGGLVGTNGSNSGAGTINNSYATGDVSGTSDIGGLIGQNISGTAANNYAAGTVSSAGGIAIGGLVGENQSSINGSYATGSVNAGTSTAVGGLVGMNQGMVANSYASGSVGGAQVQNVGGLVGQNNGLALINDSYSTGSVSGVNGIGGLVGTNSGTVNKSFWDTVASGQSASAGGTGLTSTQMTQFSSFAGWNISATGGSGDVWRIYQGHTAPLLTSFLTPLTLSGASDAAVTYNGTIQSGGASSIAGVLGAAATGTGAGFYNGYYSTQQGYDISGGNLTINPAVLTATGFTASSKVYDGTTAATLNGGTLQGVIAGDTVASTGFGTFASKNAGANIPVSINLSGPQAADYVAVETGLAANITPKTITATGFVSSNKVYDGTTAAKLKGGTLIGVIAGDIVKLTPTGTFASKNVGTNIPVTVKLTGPQAADYVAVATANITPKAVTVTATSGNMVYTGSTPDTAHINYIAKGVLKGDVLSFSDTSATFASAGVGKNIVVTISGITDSGAEAGNYQIADPTTTTKANITKP